MSILRVSLFGTVKINHDLRPAEIKIPPKAQALLAYLLLHGPRLHPRERLLDLFWGDYSVDRARGSLSTTVWRLRRALEPPDSASGVYLVTTAADEIGFNWESDHWLDVLAFEQQASRLLDQPSSTLQPLAVEELETTLQLYKGDLLEGFYDDWAIQEQERLRCLYLDCQEHLMRYYYHNSQYEKGLACGQQILRREPLHEDVHREIMRSYLASDQRALAIRQYELCRDILARELKLAPMPETRALYDQALNGLNSAVTAPHETDLRPALNHLSQAMQSFGETQRQLEQARQRFEQAQRYLQRAIRLIEQSIVH